MRSGSFYDELAELNQNLYNKEINTSKQTNYLKDKQKQAKELIDKYSNEINNQMNIVKNQTTKLK